MYVQFYSGTRCLTLCSPTTWTFPQEIGIVTYCSEPDFGGECEDVEPFDACVGLEGDPFDKRIVSFATSECTNCEREYFDTSRFEDSR